jgi:pimeloyl-ACP methyl ester carboxylesterase
MQGVSSKDGTHIAFERSGQGQPLIIIGGSLADNRFYAPLAGELAKHFAVYNFDRRGRGQTVDTQPYAVEREIEDVDALIAHAQAPVVVVGHSAGAALALRAAAAGSNISKLALTDLPYTPHGDDDETAKVAFVQEAAHIQALIDQNDYEGSVRYFLSGFGLPAEAVEEILQSPAGETMIDCARTLPYDFAMLGDGLIPDDLAAKVSLPTLVLAAKATTETAQALVNLMPSARLQVMDAPTHELSPEVVASVLKKFFI